MHKITPQEYTVLSKYIHDVSGIALDKGKEYLIETRLGPIIKDLGCSTFAELYTKSTLDKTGTIKRKIVDAITTNETSFFRDISPFELLQHKIIPDLIDKKKATHPENTPVNIRIWSAATSHGQEIYSIAIILKELYLSPEKYSIELIGTDISAEAISRASYGRYSNLEISRGLSPQRIKRYFHPDGDGWKIKDEIRSMAVFQKLNLQKMFLGLGKFDIILCRNVAIYFTPEERSRLYDKIAEVLSPHGYLIIGATESLANESRLFFPQKYLRSVFYQLRQH